MLYGFGFGISMTGAVNNICRYNELIIVIYDGVDGNLGSVLCNIFNSICEQNFLNILSFILII